MLFAIGYDTHLVRVSLVVDGGEEIFPDRFILNSGLVAFCIYLFQLLQLLIIILQVLTDQIDRN